MVDVKILTIFPGVFESFLQWGNPARAIDAKLMSVEPVDLRDFTTDRHRSTDDYPYGGGSGMVMKPEPIVHGIRRLRRNMGKSLVILTTPQGRPFDQAIAIELAQCDGLILVCGRYEGVDERVRSFVDDEISIGDYILSGGETAAMVIIDAVSRLIPGVISADSHSQGESFYNGLLEYPHYTRPPVFEDMDVPQILLEGHHAKIERWRKVQALKRTLSRRPDLLKNNSSDEYQDLLEEIKAEESSGEGK
jgi:tRNA (guanine37-N1)-methyltransferase